MPKRRHRETYCKRNRCIADTPPEAKRKLKQLQAKNRRLRKGIKAVCDLINNTGRVNKWKILNWLEQALK